MKIKTNNTPRLLLSGYELTDREREEFDYMSGEDIALAIFVRYKGHIWNIGEFLRVTPDSELGQKGFDGYETTSAFTATVIRITEDSDRVIMGSVYY